MIVARLDQTLACALIFSVRGTSVWYNVYNIYTTCNVSRATLLLHSNENETGAAAPTVEYRY